MQTHRSDPRPPRGTIVFAGVEPGTQSAIEALRACDVDAIMVSFQYMGKREAWLHTALTDPPWRARRYLDSGMFTLMVKAGLHNTLIPHAHKKTLDWRAECEKLADRFIAYLEQYHSDWDHIVELDTDLLLGQGSTLHYRERLYDIVGDKLLPVWHKTNSFHEWDALCDRFSYVAVGGIAGGPKQGERQMVRHLCDRAHARGVFVHGLGVSNPQEFLAVGWDTGDSTTWLSSAKYGKFGLMQYTTKTGQRSRGSPIGSDTLAFEAALRAKGLDPGELLKPGTKPVHKLMAGIYAIQEHQIRIRAAYASRHPAVPR